jgi:hypothetical protein
MSIVEKLTEGIINRNVQKEGQAVQEKWEKTGLLEGIENEHGRQTMSCLLENQAKELLREASSMQVGDVEGFAAVAFPIVRRVFGGLIANDLVSVQPMSLPSGLIFFLDFQYNGTRLGNNAEGSVYGGGKVGSAITGGVSLTGDNAEHSFYNLNNGYSSPTGSSTFALTPVLSGTFGSGDAVLDRICRFDPDFTSGTTQVYVGSVSIPTSLTGSGLALNEKDYVTLSVTSSAGNCLFGTGINQIRRLTQLSGTSTTTLLVFGARLAGGGTPATDMNTVSASATYSWAATDNITQSNTLGAVVGATAWGLENNAGIPEIDIKVDSVSITAITKKLKAKWTPELQQDINAYHNLDAEVELTGILSEHIALEIDQEILEDLVKGATAGTQYWSRRPGKFVDSGLGTSINGSLFPDFTGTVSEWYETLLETVNDVSAQIHRKTLRGGANFLVTSPEVANIMEFTAGFRASTTADENKGTAGAVKVGQISKKWDVYVDPYFPRNLILVGRKGNSFLESGYVYAPYVPLQITPTIFGTEDFVPRKGVMTRYGKKMVRPDMYGLVIVEDLLG